MRVTALTVDPFTGLPLVLLRSDGHASERWTGKTVPISVGLGEASAIATELENIELERPSTHHLMSDMLEKAGIAVERVDILPISSDDGGGNGRYFARIVLALPGGDRVMQDGRPSDAIALALRNGADICVDSELVERLGVAASASMAMGGAVTGAGFGGFEVTGPIPLVDDLDLHEAGDDVFGKWKM